MELRRSRRLAGLEPEEIKEEALPIVRHEKTTGFCEATLVFLGSYLAISTMTRAALAVVYVPGYCLF